MYICLECGRLFEEPKHYTETHGLDFPPYEKWTGCPYCAGMFVETFECDKCGKYITTENYCEIGDDKFCENCFGIKELGCV